MRVVEQRGLRGLARSGGRRHRRRREGDHLGTGRARVLAGHRRGDDGVQAAAVGTTFEQLGRRQLQQAVVAEDYATSLIRAKQGIHDVIAEYSPLYEAALIDRATPAT
jgi:hypothetical protein